MALLTSYWSLDGIIIFLLFLVATYLYVTRKFRYWKNRGVMEIPPVPFLGNFWETIFLKRSPGEILLDLYKQSTGLPYMGFYIFDKPSILIRDPELVKNILIKDFNYFSDRFTSPDANDRLGYANLFMMKNPGWKILRSKLTPIFTSSKLKKMLYLMLDIGEDLDKYLDSLNLKAKNIQIKEVCTKFVIDMIGTTFFGCRTNTLSNPDAEFRKYSKKIFDINILRGFEIIIILLYPEMIKATKSSFFGKEANNFFRRTFWQLINERIASGVKRNDLIDLLIELKNTYGDQDLGGFKFNDDDLVAQAAIFFSAGFETSSTVMASTIYELALNQEIQTRLRQEILDALDENNGKITFEMINSMKYMNMVVSESLRKNPPFAYLDRIAVKNYKLPNSNVVIEKGTPVWISIMGMHYDEQYFPNPTKLDPERFNEENKRNIFSNIYFPFGIGPRVCIGIRMALLQIKLGIIHLLKQHEYSPSEHTTIPMHLNSNYMPSTQINEIQLNVRKLIPDVA